MCSLIASHIDGKIAHNKIKLNHSRLPHMNNISYDWIQPFHYTLILRRKYASNLPTHWGSSHSRDLPSH